MSNRAILSHGYCHMPWHLRWFPISLKLRKKKTLQLWWTDHMFPGPVAEFISCWYGFIVSWCKLENPEQTSDFWLTKINTSPSQPVAFFMIHLGQSWLIWPLPSGVGLGKLDLNTGWSERWLTKNNRELIIWVWVKTPGTPVDPKVHPPNYSLISPNMDSPKPLLLQVTPKLVDPGWGTTFPPWIPKSIQYPAQTIPNRMSFSACYLFAPSRDHHFGLPDVQTHNLDTSLRERPSCGRGVPHHNGVLFQWRSWAIAQDSYGNLQSSTNFSSKFHGFSDVVQFLAKKCWNPHTNSGLSWWSWMNIIA